MQVNMTISIEEYHRLKQDSERLQSLRLRHDFGSKEMDNLRRHVLLLEALKQTGVDNWEGFEDACDLFILMLKENKLEIGKSYDES